MKNLLGLALNITAIAAPIQHVQAVSEDVTSTFLTDQTRRDTDFVKYWQGRDASKQKVSISLTGNKNLILMETQLDELRAVQNKIEKTNNHLNFVNTEFALVQQLKSVSSTVDFHNTLLTFLNSLQKQSHDYWFAYQSDFYGRGELITHYNNLYENLNAIYEDVIKQSRLIVEDNRSNFDVQWEKAAMFITETYANIVLFGLQSEIAGEISVPQSITRDHGLSIIYDEGFNFVNQNIKNFLSGEYKQITDNFSELIEMFYTKPFNDLARPDQLSEQQQNKYKNDLALLYQRILQI